jgi:hypothetical protein
VALPNRFAVPFQGFERLLTAGRVEHHLGWRVGYLHFPIYGDCKMDQRDQDLLEKQVGRISPPPRSDGIMALAVLAVFFAGMTIGGFMYAYENEPMQIAANDVTSIVTPHGAPSIMR